MITQQLLHPGHRPRMAETRHGPQSMPGGLDKTVSFLSCPASYDPVPGKVEVVETHMSLLFFAGDLIYKLKLPVRLPFLDWRTLEQRQLDCEREVAVNQDLAPGIYLGAERLVRGSDGRLHIGGRGETVDWLVVMRRLDRSLSLDRLVSSQRVTQDDLDRICDRLAGFYRKQQPLDLSPQQMLDRWQAQIEIVDACLSDSKFDLPHDLTQPVLTALWRYIDRDRDQIEARVSESKIVDGHGDLKPEHIYLGDHVTVIDRLEFDERLRWSDPFDEIAFLGTECSRLGMPSILPGLVDRMAERLNDRPPDCLLRFYRCYRACLRARLSIEHLLDEHPRTPELWPRQARAYLRLAAETLPFDGQS